MSVSRILRPWAAQPQGAAEVAPEFLSYAPFSVIVPSVGGRAYDLWNKKSLTPGSASLLVANTSGLANKSNGSTNFDAGGGFKLLNSSVYGYTVICVVSTTSTSSGNFIFSYANTGVSYFGIRATGSATSIQVTWTEGTNVTYTGVPNWADGKPHVIALVSYGTNDRKVFIDGVLVASSTNGLSKNSTPYQYIGLGGLNRNSHELPMACEISLLAGFDEAIPESRLGELRSSNVWQLFEPRRIFVPMAAGGAPGASTITPADGASVTSALAGIALAAAAITPAAGTSATSTLVGSSGNISSAGIGAAAGSSTASTLTGSATSAAALTAAAGASTAAAIVGGATVAAVLSTAAGTSASASLVGSSTAAAAITAAAGVSTAATLSGVSGIGSTISVASGASVAAALAGSSIAVASINAATGASTAGALAGASLAAASITPSAGASNAATLSGEVGNSAIDPASGMSVCAVLAGSSIVVAGIVPASGSSTTAALAPVGVSGPAREFVRRSSRITTRVARESAIATSRSFASAIDLEAS